MIEGGNYEIQPTPLHKDEEGQAQQGDRTASLIDNFLRTASATSDDKPTGAPHHQPTAADATGDYAAFLLQLDDAVPDAADESKPTDRSAELIDDFIDKSPNAYNCKTSLNTHPSKLPTRTTPTMRQKTAI